MKQVYFLLILIGITSLLSAQITLDHSFDNQASYNIQQVKLDISGKKYCLVNVIDSITYQFELLNSDYSPFKTININLGSLFVTSEYKSPELNINYIAEHLFDLDDDVDLLGELTYLDKNDDYYAQVVIFHENGSTLFASDIDNSNAWLVNQTMGNSPMVASIVNTPSGTRLIMDVFYFGQGLYKYEVFSLPGSLPGNLLDLKSGSLADDGSMEFYPNPGNDAVNFRFAFPESQTSGSIKLIDSQGHIVKTLPFNTRQGVMKINVNDLANGLYYSRMNSRRGLPRTAKLMIAR